jgi:hypothetical protein
MPEASSSVVSPKPESRVEAVPNLLIRIGREWPDATARAVIVAVALGLFWLTWAHWGSIQVDCGRELYIPYQLQRGKLLYRDLWFPHGPLASYVEALLIGVFGQHLNAFYLFGFAIAVSCALLSLQMGLMIQERAAGIAAALVLLLQGFAPTPFNYIFPYAYTGPLGLLLVLMCACFTIRDTLGRPGHNLIVAGLAAGLATLCKQEMGVVCYILLAFTLLTKAITQRSTRAIFRGAAECIPGVILWTVVYGWFFYKLTASFILFDNWQFFPGSYFMKTYGATYAALLGFRFVPSELMFLILEDVAILLLWYQFARVNAKWAWRWPFVAMVLALASVTGSVRYFASARQSLVAVSPLLFLFPPGMFFIAIGFFAFNLYKLRNDPGERKLLSECVLAVFALALSLRILSQVEPVDYGIYYDIPLFLIFLIVIKRCARPGLPSLTLEAQTKNINSLFTIEVIMLAIILVPLDSARTAKLETSWGEIYLEPIDVDVAHQIVDFILEKKRSGARVVVLPEGHMMYALTRTESPNRWETIIPGVLSPSQEEDYLADLRRVRPDYIVLTNRRTADYGASYFGIDYDRKIYQWIGANYLVAGEFGHFRRDDSLGWAALLYARRGQH